MILSCCWILSYLFIVDLIFDALEIFSFMFFCVWLFTTSPYLLVSVLTHLFVLLFCVALFSQSLFHYACRFLSWRYFKSGLSANIVSLISVIFDFFVLVWLCLHALLSLCFGWKPSCVYESCDNSGMLLFDSRVFLVVIMFLSLINDPLWRACEYLVLMCLYLFLFLVNLLFCCACEFLLF